MQTILYHAKLYVARGDFRSALCAEDGIIRAVGSDAEILALARPGCRTIDCGGRTVVPGFNDSHLHLMQLAETRYEAPISGVRSVDELQTLAVWLEDDRLLPRLLRGPSGTDGAWAPRHRLEPGRLPGRTAAGPARSGSHQHGGSRGAGAGLRPYCIGQYAGDTALCGLS